jgi:glutamine amidotransferase
MNVCVDVSTTAGITLNRKFPGDANGDPRNAVKGNSKEHLKQRSKEKMEKEEHGLHVIVASEPTTFKPAEWTLLEKNHGMYTQIVM